MIAAALLFLFCALAHAQFIDWPPAPRVSIDTVQYNALVTILKAMNAPKELWSKTSDKICDDNALITTGTVIRCKNSNITELNFADQPGWQGTISSEIGRLSALKKLSLRNISLFGSLPTEIGKLSALDSIYIVKNKIEGAIPSEIGQMAELNLLNVEFNQIVGSIPSQLSRLTALEYLTLASNNLTGTLPSGMEKLSWLRIVDVSRNNIGGTIPSAIARWTSLMGISVAFNMFSGTLPSSMSTLTRLSSFDFRDNFFSGPLPNFNVPLQDCYFQVAESPNCFDCRNKPDACRCDRPLFPRDCSKPSRAPTTTTVARRTTNPPGDDWDPRLDQPTEPAVPSMATRVEMATIVCSLVASWWLIA